MVAVPSFAGDGQRALEDGHGRSNCQNLFGISAIPTDAYIRLMLDGAATAAFDPGFYKTIETAGVLAPHHLVIASDHGPHQRSGAKRRDD